MCWNNLWKKHPVEGWDIPKLWFQVFFYFHPENWGRWSNLTNIFQRGWNHQLEKEGWLVMDYSWLSIASTNGLNWWFGTRCFGFRLNPRKWKGLLLGGIPRIPNHQLTISWFSDCWLLMISLPKRDSTRHLDPNSFPREVCQKTDPTSPSWAVPWKNLCF